MPHAYASAADLKAAYPAETEGVTDARLLSLLKAVSEQIDDYTCRTFRTYTATLYFTVENYDDRLWLPDLLALTTLKSDTAGNRTYATTWLATDYDLEPYDAPDYGRPYTEVRRAPNGAQAFVVGSRRHIEIAGKWGYWEQLEVAGATLSGAVSSTTATSVGVADFTKLGIGQTVLVDGEQMFIHDLVAGTPPAMTVDRGVNGTTAATHLTGAALSRYVYPAVVVETAKEAMAASLAMAARVGVASERVGDIALSYRDVMPSLSSRLSGLRRCAMFT